MGEERILKSLADNAGDILARRRLAELLESRFEYGPASVEYGILVSLDGTDVLARIALGRCFYKAEFYEKALDALQRVDAEIADSEF